MSQAPIGIMDSGFGGLSVWKEVQELLPSEEILYFADSGFCPYGSRPEQQVFDLTHRIVRFFLDKGCKMIVLACNTATAAAIQKLRKIYEVPFIGMEPALKPAAQATQTGVIGILATTNTFRGAHFHKTREAYANDKQLLVQPGYGLVELVENGQIEGEETRQILLPLISPMLDAGVDQLVLGCSHYPFLSKEIRQLVGEKMTLIDPAPAVARQVERLLIQNQLVNQAPPHLNYHFYSSGNLFALKAFIERNLKGGVFYRKILEKKCIPWQGGG